MSDARPKRILFVCLGNICRSPMAEAIFLSLSSRTQGLFEVDSAGTYGGHQGEASDPRMRQAAHARAYAMTHRARRITAEDFEIFDWILTMDDRNYEDVCALAPSLEAQAKVHRMADFCAPGVDHIPDPYYEGAEGFDYVIDLLEIGCRNLLDHLQEQD